MSDLMLSSFRTHRPSGLLRLTRGLGALFFVAVLACSAVGLAHAASPFAPGDLVVGLGSSPDGSSQGKLRHFSPSGALLDTLLTTSGSFEETGPCFDAARNLFTTNFEANSVSKFGANGSLLDPGFAIDLNQAPNSCSFDGAGNLYIGLSDKDGNIGGGGLLKLSPAGLVLGSFQPAPDQRGTDWIDLAADQCTLFYTSLGGSIKRFDLCAPGTPGHPIQQLADFCIACDDGDGGATSGPFFALRLLPDGGLLVADFNGFSGNGRVRRYDNAGAQVRDYVATNSYGSICGDTGDQPCFFPWALVLDPDLTSFWTADYITGEVFKFDLTSGAALSSFQAGICDDFYSLCAVTGLAIAGEPTAAAPVGAATVTAGIVASDKVYDTTPAATITSCTLSGVQPADVGDVGCTTSGAAFADANVGTGKPVSATVTLTGSAAGNYTLTSASASTTAKITPAPASVSPNAASKTYGAADPTFTGSLSGFLESVTVTYSRTAGESVAGSPYTISAALSPAGVLGNYSIIYNTAAFTITKVNASVTPNPASKTYGAADPAFTGSLSGFLAADGVTASYSRTAGESVAGSPYTISATLNPAGVLGNYNVTYNTAAFTINKANASVTPNAASKTYGTADPSFTGTLSGFLAADGVTATYSRSAGESVAGSPYTISAALSPAGALDNYNVTYNTAAFIINKANASVSPDAASKTYGAADPALTGALAGFLASDGVTATYSRTAGESVAGSPYTISATLSPAGALGNYNVTYNTAGFTITKANASVTPSAASKTYGTADPVFTGALSGFVAADGVTATYSRTAGESVGGSPYTISATLSPAGALGNYNITYNTAAFSITRATASVTPNAASKTYGTPDPTFTGSVTGFLASDGVTAAYNRTAGESVTGSPYTISAMLSATGALDNYDISYNTASFTITKATASVTPDAATKVFGTPDPVLTGTVSGFLAGDAVTAAYTRTAGEGVAGSPYTISATLSPAAALGNYVITYNTAAFAITPATPVVTWANPADITYPTPLTGIQLNATADVPGTFDYTPAAGTVLSPGNGQPLYVLFTPTDSSDYTTATAQVVINVLQADVSIVKSTSTPSIHAGETATYSLIVTGNGPGSSSDVVLTDTLPAGLIWTVGGSDAAACLPASPVEGGTTLTCNFGTVGQGETRTVTLTGTTTLTWAFTPQADGVVGTSTGADYQLAGDVIHADAFVGSSSTDNGTPAFVYGRNDGADQVGTGVCGSVSGGSCTDPVSGISATNQGLLRFNLGAGAASLSGVVLQVKVSQPGDTFRVLTSALDTIDGATLLHEGTSDDDSVAISLGGVQQYLFVQAGSTGTVLVQALGANTCGVVANTAAVTATGDRDASNNSAGPVNVTVSCPTTVTANITAANKTYDGTTTATITSCTLTGVSPADAGAVTCDTSNAAFATASAGTGKPVSAMVSLSGAAASQYVLASPTASTTADITPAPATVTPSAASKTYGAADPSLTGTLSGFLASDGVTATYSRTAGESVAGSPYAISATLSPAAVLGNYDITYNTAALTITPATATVTPNAASKTYGTSDPTFTGTLTGFRPADGVTAIYSRTGGETVAGSPYTISATLSPAGALGNYNVTYNTAGFTITKATASVTPNAATKVYGAADPVFTGSLSGFLAADAVTATYSRTAGETVAGSPYTISATLSPAGALANYNVTYNTAGFTITKATASVTPNAATKVYGGADPALTGSLSGFRAADAVTATYSRTAGETVAGSPYAISATLSPAGALGNYNVTYNTAGFTITKASASVTPNAATKVYGAADPAFSGTLSGFRAADGVTATYSRTAGETVAGSPYAISATLSPAGVLGNYTITYNTASLTITKANASVTPNAATKVYGAADPALTGTLFGFRAADGVAASFSRTAGETVAGSPYAISATLSPAGVLGNYTITYNTASFTITKANASVTPNAATKVYGAPDPPLTGTLSGFGAEDGVTATYSRTPGETVAGSPYTISATLYPAGVLGNYNVTYNTANFTITASAALSLTKTANPTTYAYVGQTIVYTYVVQNTGGAVVTGPFMITDDKLGAFQCGTATSLAPAASISCTASYVVQASDLGTVPSLPTGVVANVNTGAWLQGVMSTQDTTITGAGPGVPNGIYPGWCIQDHVPNDLHNQPGTLYSTIGGSLPADVAGLPWNKINFVINHKIRGAGKSDLQFFQDVQTAIWLLLGEQNPDFGKSAEALQMVANANAHPTFVPGQADSVAVIIYSDGMGTSPSSIQESIIEMKPFQQITNHATATGQYGGATIQSNMAQATVSQAASAPPVDTAAYGDQGTAKTSVTTTAFSTSGGNRLLLAFVSADNTGGTNTTVTSITGAGLTWQLVVRSNAQRGTAEIWRAFAASSLTNVTVKATLSQSVASSLTVLALTGIDTSGSNGSGAIGRTATASGASGAPTVTFTTTRSNSWVFGVGTDWDNAIPRTVGPNQTLVHQYMPPVNDTYWVQRRINPTGPSSSTVTLNDVAPTSDRWNLAAVEILVPSQ